MSTRIAEYIRVWKQRGYHNDIPEEVPTGLMQAGLAPSYKAICIAILKNDASLQSLGFAPPRSPWYEELKRIELSHRSCISPPGRRRRVSADHRQLVLFSTGDSSDRG